MEKKLRYIAVCAVFLSAAVFFSITAKSPGNAGGVNLPKYSEIADENSEKTGKTIKKAKNAAEFQAAAAAVFRDCRVRANAVPLWFKPA